MVSINILNGDNNKSAWLKFPCSKKEIVSAVKKIGADHDDSYLIFTEYHLENCPLTEQELIDLFDFDGMYSDNMNVDILLNVNRLCKENLI